MIALLAELAERFPERGFDKLFQLIRRRGLVWLQVDPLFLLVFVASHSLPNAA